MHEDVRFYRRTVAHSTGEPLSKAVYDIGDADIASIAIILIIIREDTGFRIVEISSRSERKFVLPVH